MTAPPRSKAQRDEWAAGMEALHREAAGCLELWTVLVTDVPSLILASRGGSAMAFSILTAVNHAVGQIQAAPRRKPALCGCCSRVLRNADFAIVLASPANQPMASHAVALAICQRCGTDRASVEASAARALKDVWPEARPITVTHAAGGRA